AGGGRLPIHVDPVGAWRKNREIERRVERAIATICTDLPDVERIVIAMVFEVEGPTGVMQDDPAMRFGKIVKAVRHGDGGARRGGVDEFSADAAGRDGRSRQRHGASDYAGGGDGTDAVHRCSTAFI